MLLFWSFLGWVLPFSKMLSSSLAKAIAFESKTIAVLGDNGRQIYKTFFLEPISGFRVKFSDFTQKSSKQKHFERIRPINKAK